MRPSFFVLTADAVGTGISDLAAQLRAEHNLKIPDAIQIASALSNGLPDFVCNDKAFRKVKDIDCLILGELDKKK